MQLAMPAVFVLGVLLVMPLGLFVYDNDEGINVMKAVLMADGYPLYTETWSDQPPVFTQLLAWSFALFGQSMIVARLLVLVLTTIFVWAFTNTIRLHLGTAAAWVALLLLMLSDNFMRLSVSVMIGLPALSFAMVGIYLLQRFKVSATRHAARLWYLLGGGILLGVAVQTKVFVAFLVPLLALDLVDWGRNWRDPEERRWTQVGHVVLFGAATVLTWGAIGVYYHALDFNMLLSAHLNTNVQSAYEGEGGWGELSRYLRFDYGHVLLGLAGAVAILVRRQWSGLLPLSWLVGALILLSNHSPIWYHHYQIVAIPLCWLTAYLTPLFQAQPDHSSTPATAVQAVSYLPRIGVAVALFFVLVLGYTRVKESIPLYNQRSYDAEIVALLQQDAANTHWVFTDRAIYPFYAGLPVPPEIAVFSRKRFFGHTLNNTDLLTVMETYQPEQVLLMRFRDDLLTDAQFVGYLDAHYTKVAETPDYVYFQVNR
jgi:4-amino-4-deoxy-L-arabinose transferase-like glycosyltransferase